MLLKHERQTYKVFFKALRVTNLTVDQIVRFGQQINNEKTSNEDNYYEEWNADIYDNRRDGVFD